MRISSRSLTAFLLVFSFLAAPMSAAGPPALQKASAYTGEQAVAGWMMSEKLDGIRGYWNGRTLLTRKGKTIHAPEWFVAGFPPFALDGELWRERNDFAFVQNTVLDVVPGAGWHQITYNIFEAPEASGNFDARLERARAWFEAHPAAHVRIIEQIVCKGPEHLTAFLDKVESLGGEGVIVKNPKLAFHSGRSPYVLKVKTFDDMEGVVLAHRPGKGKFSGMMGSLTLRLDNGVTFNLGTGFSTRQRSHPPPVGAVVTFKYQGFTKAGVPRFASFLRVRQD